jgi:hypothetical protein
MRDISLQKTAPVYKVRFISFSKSLPESLTVGLPRIELGPYPPHGHILPLYYSPDWVSIA